MVRWLSKTAAVFSAASMLILPAHSPQAKGYEKPNIIVMMADDYGNDAASLYNARTEDPDFPKNAPTPTLAELADQGVLFQNGWAMPVCSTTRGTRSMGKLPSTSGMGWIIGRFTPYPNAGDPFPPSMVDPGDPNLIHKLAQEAGYRTYKLGKWHETQAAENNAESINDLLDSGFDEFYGQLSGAPLPLGYGGDSDWIPASSRDEFNGIATREFLTSALVSRAIEFIDEAKATYEPYYISLDFAAPHLPYEVAPGPKEPTPDGTNEEDFLRLTLDDHADVIVQVIVAFNDDLTKADVPAIRADLEANGLGSAYLDRYPPAGTRAPWVFPAPPPPPNPAQARAAFKSLVAYMDLQIDRLMKHVNLTNTYVIFAGDNGTFGTIGGNAYTTVVEAPNDPARSKQSLYRNGVEVPFLIAGPHVRKKGRKSNALVTTTDIYATVLDLIGVKQPKATRRDSISFTSVLYGGPGKRRINVAELFAATPSVGGTATGPRDGEGRVVANRRYRLLAKPVAEAGAFVCREDSIQLPENECLNPDTGVYEKQHVLEFYDIKVDPFEHNALVRSEMTKKQYKNFRNLCKRLNKISKSATYFQNGKVCELNGENLVDADPGI